MPLYPANPLPVSQGGTGSTTSTGTGATVLATSPTLVSPVTVSGSSGTLVFEAATDGGDLNIYSTNGNQVLAFFGSGGNTLNLNLLDGYLAVGSNHIINNNGNFGVNGATPQGAYASGGAVVTTTPALTSYGYTLAQATAVLTLVNNIRAALVANGIMS